MGGIPKLFSLASVSLVAVASVFFVKRSLSTKKTPPKKTKRRELYTYSTMRAPNSRKKAPRHVVRSDDFAPFYVTENADDYRAAISEVVKAGDTAIEVGCHQGMTTSMIARQVGETGRVLGIDVSSFALSRAEAHRQTALGDEQLWAHRLRFELVDMFDMGKVLEILHSWAPGAAAAANEAAAAAAAADEAAVAAGTAEAEERATMAREQAGTGGAEEQSGQSGKKAKKRKAYRKASRLCEVVFIDVSGNRELRTLAPLLDAYDKALRPKCIVVKSFKLLKLVNRSVVWPPPPQ